MQTLYFLLGNTPELSLLELQSVLSEEVELVTPSIARLTTQTSLSPSDLMFKLGGTVKIMSQVIELDLVDTDSKTLTSLIGAQLKKTHAAQNPQKKKIEFGVTVLGETTTEELPETQELKAWFQSQGIPSRYRDSNHQGVQAAALLHHPEMLDIFFSVEDSKLKVLVTNAVQDIDDWTKRDRQKPYADRKKGMLPPKVARMMVNIGLGTAQKVQNKQSTYRIYDPFCGSGTVLMEAAFLGNTVLGSDLDLNSVTGTKQNLSWLNQEYETPDTQVVFKSDVSKTTLQDLGKPVDIIVTEPFLGKPKPAPNQIKNIVKGLNKLYIGAAKKWHALLADNGVIVMVIPAMDSGYRTYTLTEFIDKLPDLGYTIASGPVEYARKQATVKRQIYVLVKK